MECFEKEQCRDQEFIDFVSEKEAATRRKRNWETRLIDDNDDWVDGREDVFVLNVTSQV